MQWPRGSRALLAGFIALAILVLPGSATAPVRAATSSIQAVTWPVILSGGPGGVGSAWRIVPDGGTSTGRPDTGDCQNPPPANYGVLLDDGAIDNSNPKNAFDQAGLWINDRVFTSTTALVTGTQTLTAGPMILASGLEVTLEYYAASQSAILRTLASFRNPTASTAVVTPTLAVNLRSDSSTVFLGTSDGNTSFGLNDRWAVTGDGAAVDAVVTTVLYGPYFPSASPDFVADTVFACPGGQNAGLLAEFQVTVPPGATRRLMFFNQLSLTNAAALAAAPSFDANPASGSDLAAGLSEAQLKEVVNWDYRERVYLPSIRR